MGFKIKLSNIEVMFITMKVPQTLIWNLRQQNSTRKQLINNIYKTLKEIY